MKKLLCFVMTLVLLWVSIPMCRVYAENETQPTIIVNDEKWYKDAVSPLIVRDDVVYVPADVFAMLDYIAIIEKNENNILIVNTETKSYVSLLFMESAAAINGVVVENIGLFRDSGVLYVEAETAAESLGLEYEYYSSDTLTIRFYDESRVITLDELVHAYGESDTAMDENETDSAGVTDESMSKKVYVFCSTPENSDAYFKARDTLELYGVAYTYLVDENTSDGMIVELMANGDYCLKMPYYTSEESDEDTADVIAAYLDGLNARLKKLSGKITRYVVCDDECGRESLLAERGYYIIRPEYTVNGASYPDGMVSDMDNSINEKGYTSIYLEDCWNSERMTIILAEMQDNDIKPCNIAD